MKSAILLLIITAAFVIGYFLVTLLGKTLDEAKDNRPRCPDRREPLRFLFHTEDFSRRIS